MILRPETAKHLVLPNVFLAGVRKCGTTSLFHWLSDHPAVCSSAEKGTEFLMDQDSLFRNRDSNYHDHGLEAYGRHFSHYAGESVVLDATTRYYDQETPRRVLAGLVPRPRVLFVLREPTDRLYSEFRYLKNNRQKLDPRVPFAEFVRLVESGRIGKALVKTPVAVAEGGSHRFVRDITKAIDHGRYVDYLLPWREAIGPDRVHVYLFEDLKRDASRFARRMAEDLGIDPSFYASYRFAGRNGTVQFRSPWLHRWLRRLKVAVPRTNMTRRAYSLYLRLQHSSQAARSRDDEAALASLKRHYRLFNERLAREFDLDLAAWR